MNQKVGGYTTPHNHDDKLKFTSGSILTTSYHMYLQVTVRTCFRSKDCLQQGK